MRSQPCDVCQSTRGACDRRAAKSFHASVRARRSDNGNAACARICASA
jgi:hypothetical protein